MLLILNPRRKKSFLLLFYFIFRDLEIFKRAPLAFLSAKSIGDGERTDGGGRELCLPEDSPDGAHRCCGRSATAIVQLT